jgi:hypothetical protein
MSNIKHSLQNILQNIQWKRIIHLRQHFIWG